ncbi:MAG: hypothetical protein OSA06_06605 [Acidimicrobiales bacterium]|nr:hypothetical protein [Acidimicrobiales bacterium]
MINPGQNIIRASRLGTLGFTLMAVLSVLYAGPLRALGLLVNLGLFLAGCVTFLLAFFRAVGRSRTENIGVGGLYFLAGCAPQVVRRQLMGALSIQVMVAFTAASFRPFTTVASTVLVPVFGLGLAGLWGSRHGNFGPR